MFKGLTALLKLCLCRLGQSACARIGFFALFQLRSAVAAAEQAQAQPPVSFLSREEMIALFGRFNPATDAQLVELGIPVDIESNRR